MCQAMLFIVMHTSYLTQTSLNWSQPTKLDAEVMHCTLGVECPIITDNHQINLPFQTVNMAEY